LTKKYYLEKINKMPVRKILTLILLGAIFTILSLFSPADTLATWTKYENNPVLEGTEGKWDNASVANQKVLYINGVYKMWYSGHNGNIWQIGYATSPDGLIWEKYTQPIITPNSAENWENRTVKEVTHPSVLFTPPNKYEMWYCVISSTWQTGEDRFRVKYASSNDGINWNIYPGYVLIGTPNKWDRGGIGRGFSIIKVDNTYKMWYSGVNEQNKWGIGFATSKDGINWNKYPSNEEPQEIITPNNLWEKSWLSYPYVLYNGQIYYMFYVSASSGTGENIVYAISTDGINWEKPNNGINPIITVGDHGSFDSHDIVTPSVIKEDGIFKMWYSGFNGNKWRIGFASGELPPSSPTPPPLPPHPLPFASGRFSAF